MPFGLDDFLFAAGVSTVSSILNSVTSKSQTQKRAYSDKLLEERVERVRAIGKKRKQLINTAAMIAKKDPSEINFGGTDFMTSDEMQKIIQGDKQSRVDSVNAELGKVLEDPQKTEEDVASAQFTATLQKEIIKSGAEEPSKEALERALAVSRSGQGNVLGVTGDEKAQKSTPKMLEQLRQAGEGSAKVKGKKPQVTFGDYNQDEEEDE